MSNQFGRLSFVEVAGVATYPSGKKQVWLLECACGRRVFKDASSVRQGRIKSCGCLRRDLLREAKTTHGMHGTKEYTAWNNMVRRCTSPTARGYERYGGAGVIVCDEWLRDFNAFFSHIGRSPTKRHSVDRIDSRKGYEPGNVRWATAKQQNTNRKSVHRIECNGQLLSLKDYCHAAQLNLSTVAYRISKLGWSVEDAIIPGDARKRKAAK